MSDRPESSAPLIHCTQRTSSNIPAFAKTAVDAARHAGLSENDVFLFSDKPCQAIHGINDWRQGLAASESQSESWQWDPLENSSTSTIATINYSSGTTGLPKGVLITHSNLLANVVQSLAFRDLEQPYGLGNAPPERWIGFLPLYHAYGEFSTLRKNAILMLKGNCSPACWHLRTITQYT